MAYNISLSGNLTEDVFSSQWDHLSEKISPDLRFLNKDWYSAWERNHLVQEYPQSRIEYLSLFDNQNNLQGTFPYVLHSKFGLNVLSIAGLYYPFRPVLFSSEVEPEGARTFVDAIHGTYLNSIIRIGPTAENEMTNKMIHRAFLELGWSCYEIDCGNTLIAELPDSASEYYESLGKKYKKNLERRRAKLEKLGQVKYTKYTDCSSKVWEYVIEQCASVEKRSWLAVGEDAEMRIFENRKFWMQYLQSSEASRRVVVWLITLDGDPVSFSFAIDSGACRYSFSSHYDEKYKKYGLGVIVYSIMFEDAIRSGVKIVNMGTGEADYKARLGARLDSRIVDYIYLPPTLLGRSFYAGLRARDKLRKFKNTFLR